MACQKVDTSFPTGEIMPKPVITTLFSMVGVLKFTPPNKVAGQK
jgi:hypothetical protein